MKTDTKRWTTFTANWDERTQLLADMIPHDAQSIIEFGVGNGSLREMLKDHQTYTPCDLTSRGSDTIVFDFNEPPYPEIPRHDVAVLSGVFEYIVDLPFVVEFICSLTDQIICSYVENTKGKANTNGWCNTHSQNQFQQLFTVNGFTIVEKDLWGKQVLYNFKR